MSKTANQNIQKIERMQVEKVIGGSIHLKLHFFKCVECGSESVRRTVSSYSLKSYKSEPNPHFNCTRCGNQSEYIQSDKHNACMSFEAYREVLKEEI